LILLALDASVAAKWFLVGEEPLKDRALALRERHERGEVEFIIPDLFWAELGNVMWKAVRQGRCSLGDAEESLHRAKGLGLPTVPSEALVESAITIAARYNRSFYDSLYVALAISHHATLVTADEKLANATAAHLPVKWLGAWQ
jgi:predicted nucleic acid-binding protein